MTTTFKQTSKVGVAGNFINQLMGNNSTLPEVGKGATELHALDRSCYEVIEVSKDFKTVKLETLSAKASKEGKEIGMGHQSWILEPTGQFSTVVWRHNAWRVKGYEISFTDEFIKEAKDLGVGVWKLIDIKNLRVALYGEPDDCNVYPVNVIEGVTKGKDKYTPIKLIFGKKDYYHCWEF